MRDDLPADGNPTRPTSAMLLSSTTASNASPSSPSSAKPGALRRALASAALPSPPLPPLARTTRVPAPIRSAMTRPSGVLTTGPAGTRETFAPPLAPAAVLAPGAVPVAALARLAVTGLLVRAVVEVQQRVHARIHLEDDVAPVATVAAVGTAERLVLLAVHRGDPVPAVAGGHVHGHSIDESGHINSLGNATSAQASARALVSGSFECS